MTRFILILSLAAGMLIFNPVQAEAKHTQSAPVVVTKLKSNSPRYTSKYKYSIGINRKSLRSYKVKKPVKRRIFYTRKRVPIRRKQVAVYKTPTSYRVYTNDSLQAQEVAAIIKKYAQKYNVDYNRALRIARCESGLNPRAKNPNSSASGVFQQLGRYWGGRAAQYGRPGASVFDADANIDVSMQMMSRGMWSHWVCK